MALDEKLQGQAPQDEADRGDRQADYAEPAMGQESVAHEHDQDESAGEAGRAASQNREHRARNILAPKRIEISEIHQDCEEQSHQSSYFPLRGKPPQLVLQAGRVS